ncbi:GTP 3',8-cyclase MoaA [Pseudomaricurvus alcaniphilus]|uniref:GTP 3',8-cyclase MoaA n=1 Tax=Pseudomaricurvus alcaniphilus TaxID=1166482 RepID=UPI0014078D0C|nr:GTP 3',8-cyclase MoaA [Pseudomaricurvus alcaniphilus]NHN37686.1 GTP 3',8-cyclase MoaA [Pseudomaricurvus alcaniphilus]
MKLTDGFGRNITYLRLSVTDRCNYRCVYCMAEDMTFLPRAQVLSLEESAEICATFVELGVDKIRITGGEPLVRRDIDALFRQVGQLPSLRELTLTTNGSYLAKYASHLHSAGVKRINVSLDTLDPEQFQELTRFGQLQEVLDGIQAARAAGIERIKLNAVILKNRNFSQVLPLVEFALQHDLDISFIEEMPLGQVSEHGRQEEFCASADIRELIQGRYPLLPTATTTAGPSRYWQIPGRDNLIGFISPHSDNFCSSCNRIRVTAEGKLILCLGNEHSLDLKAIMRRYPGERERLKAAIVAAMGNKPEKHHFYEDDAPQIVRFMNSTGG